MATIMHEKAIITDLKIEQFKLAQTNWSSMDMLYQFVHHTLFQKSAQ